MAYKKCPRCEMNWIQDTEELCEVCKAELGIKSTITLLDDDYAEKALGAKLCPICGINYIDENEDMCESCRADKTSRAGSKHKDSSDAKQYISDYQDDNDYNPDDINADSDEDENEDELAEFEDENSGFSVIDREDLLNTDDTYTGPVLHNYDEDETEEEIFEEEEDEDDDFNYPTGSIPTDDLDDMDEEIDDDDDEDTRRK